MKPMSLLVRTALCLTAFFHLHSAQANNIQVANTTLTNNTGSTVLVQFDISWENSWRGGGVANWDAAWVFVKYKLPGDGGFSHARLEPTGHVAPGGSMIDIGLVSTGVAYNASTNPVVGVFVRRDADGTGSFSANGVQLRWNYGALGYSMNDITEVRVFAVEMVYMNQAAFYLGSGGTETYAFHVNSSNAPYQVTSEAQIFLAASIVPGALWADGEIETGTLPAAYPKGFAAAYMMKYEISQQQYVDFLNSLTRVQQAAHVRTDLSVGVSSVTNRFVMSNSSLIHPYRNGIRCDAAIDPNSSITFYCDANGNGNGGEANDGQWIASGYATSIDVAAYLDWGALRFMTELEYEKACRGPLPPLPNEFPWRTTTIKTGATTLNNAFTASEGVGTGYSATAGNAMYDLANGGFPIRVGAFAANIANSGRITAGAGYYGTMELAGNMSELIISAGNAPGRAYTGVHGNGELTSTGGHDAANWPAANAVDQFGSRGGSFGNSLDDRLRVSERIAAASSNTASFAGNGVRGVRTAP